MTESPVTPRVRVAWPLRPSTSPPIKPLPHESVGKGHTRLLGRNLRLDAGDQSCTALASGAGHREAGEVAGVSERTVRRRLEQSAFQEQVAVQREQLISRTTDRLTGLSGIAVDTLSALVSSDDTPPAVRRRAAMGILATHRVWRDAGEIEDRLRLLEQEFAIAATEQSEGSR